MNNALSMPAPVEAVVAKSKPGSRPKSDTENRGELESISIVVTENGFMVDCSFEPKTINPKLPRYDQRPENEKTSYGGPNAVQDALKYVGDMMNAQMNYEAGEAKGEKKPAKAAPKAGKKAAAEEPAEENKE